jgi:hypothetical protein
VRRCGIWGFRRDSDKGSSVLDGAIWLSAQRNVITWLEFSIRVYSASFSEIIYWIFSSLEYVLKIHVQSYERSSPFVYSNRNIFAIPYTCPTFCMPCPSNPPPFCHLDNIRWTVPVITLHYDTISSRQVITLC